MRVDYRLFSSGWAACDVEIAGQKTTVTASWISAVPGAPPALDALLAATAAVARGEARATASFPEEPGEFRWILSRPAPGRLRVRILCFRDDGSGLPDKAGELDFDADCGLADFAGAVLDAARRLHDALGTAGYAKQWGLPFPLERMRELEAALRA